MSRHLSFSEIRESRIVKTPSGCWEWMGSRTAAGYGFTGSRHLRIYTHRLFYQELIGLIPPGLEIDHLCRNRSCCNPDHLEAVTRKVNCRRGLRGLREDKTCRHGHEFSIENTYYYMHNGYVMRYCRECHRRNNREYGARKKRQEPPK